MADEQYEINVYLYPAAGAGVQIVNTPQGPVPVPVPFNEYKNVRGLVFKTDNRIAFSKRTGEVVETNVPYIVVSTPKPTTEA